MLSISVPAAAKETKKPKATKKETFRLAQEYFLLRASNKEFYFVHFKT